MNSERLTLYPDRHRGGCELLEDRIREAATQLWRSQELTDIELRASDGDIIHAHRLVLVTYWLRSRLTFARSSAGNFASRAQWISVPSPPAPCTSCSSTSTQTAAHSMKLEGSLSAVLEAAARSREDVSRDSIFAPFQVFSHTTRESTSHLGRRRWSIQLSCM